MNESLNKNLLILGAGASIDMQQEASKEIGKFGKYIRYPLGNELIHAISNKKDVVHQYFIENILSIVFGNDDLLKELSGKYQIEYFKFSGDVSYAKELIGFVRGDMSEGDIRLDKEKSSTHHFVGHNYISILAYPSMLEKLNLTLPVLNKANKSNDEAIKKFKDVTKLALAYNFKVDVFRFIDIKDDKYLDLIADYVNIIDRKFNHTLGFIFNKDNTKPIDVNGYSIHRNNTHLLEISKYFKNICDMTKDIITKFDNSQIIVDNLEEYEAELTNVFNNRDDYYSYSWVSRVDKVNNRHISEDGYKTISSELEILTTKKSFFDKWTELTLFKYSKYYNDFIIHLISNKIFPKVFIQGYSNKINIDELYKQTVEMYYLCYFVEIFQPKSIDYFMMNFNYFTKYNLLYQEQSDNALYMPKDSEIIQYGKLFIANEIMSANDTILEELKKSKYLQLNWLHNFLWHLVVMAKFQKIDEDEIPSFIEKNLTIITFNYDFTVDEILPLYLIPKKELDLSIEILYHVYGIALLKETDGEFIIKTMQNALIKKIFNKSDTYEYEHKYDDKDTKITLTKEKILKQLNGNINWIAEDEATFKEQQEKYREQIKTSKNIYFLGFGFDVNNLNRLGLLASNGQLDTNIFKGKIIYISQGNPKIRDFFKTNFKIKEWHKDNKLYTASSGNGKTQIIISDNYINTAFEKDFVLF